MSFNNDSDNIYKLLDHVRSHATQNDPHSVVKAIDEFCWKNWMMNVGDRKGQILDTEFLKKRPQNVLELGTYCGYSAVRMARLLPDGGHLYTVDPNTTYADVAKQIVEFAGLTNKVTFVEGTLPKRFGDFRKVYGVDTFDFVFLDHAKDHYLSDFMLLESENFLTKGSVIVADNVLFPGSPDYLKYIQDAPDRYRSVGYDELLEYNDNIKDQVWVSEKL